ncbi:hypothetical protein TNCV_252421 [Trichonephila clavipes]|nr:hypothetical protein TNCV_252421 [Trichonephila clavipes]
MIIERDWSAYTWSDTCPPETTRGFLPVVLRCCRSCSGRGSSPHVMNSDMDTSVDSKSSSRCGSPAPHHQTRRHSQELPKSSHH